MELTADRQLIIPKGALRLADVAINEVAAAAPDNIQEVAASQLRINDLYYQGVLAQARVSLRWALVAAGVGLAFFVVAVGFELVRGLTSAAIISALGGAVVEVISGLNFWLYAKVARQLDAFHIRLERMQRFLVANSDARSLTEEARERALEELVRTIAVSTIEGEEPAASS
ncbi:MAG: TRADD-N-associated membrane domain-containing protein [Methyloceanibacter sp.]|uniref:TRADD-N-associated membrane domain-containing protein n=1 Tax=Methyloceanibacter sp. TaxID=1965321 RepID=UPI003EE084D8